MVLLFSEKMGVLLVKELSRSCAASMGESSSPYGQGLYAERRGTFTISRAPDVSSRRYAFSRALLYGGYRHEGGAFFVRQPSILPLSMISACGVLPKTTAKNALSLFLFKLLLLSHGIGLFAT